MALHNEIGRIGEEMVSHWLNKKGWSVIEKNYRRRYGEIDIVARGTDGTVSFVEVKTVSYETKNDLEWAVSHETWRPEEMVHAEKQKRLLRTVEVWLMEHPEVLKYQIDVVTVRMVPREKYARIKMLKNLVFEPNNQ